MVVRFNQRIFRAVTLVVTALLLSLAPLDSDAAPRRNQPAPAFKTFSIKGQPISTEGLKGSVVLLDFWATWCPPCRESIPHLAELHRKYGKQGLVVVGMSVDEGGERTVKEYAERNAIPYQIVMASGKISSDYGVRALPVLYVIDKNGLVREQVMGFSDQAGKVIENLIKKLLNEK
nr:TlpA disulfide reductase family protein [Trichlorobacter sp.]